MATASSTFREPDSAAVEDVQRAVRYIRHNGDLYGIRSDPIGAVGASAGGYLADMLGVLGGQGDPQDPDAVNRESAKVQCVVSFFGPTDLIRVPPSPVLTDFLGVTLFAMGQSLPLTSVEYKTYKEASPVYWISKDTPPFLLVHGEADKTGLTVLHLIPRTTIWFAWAAWGATFVGMVRSFRKTA